MSLVIFSPCIFSGKLNFRRRKSILLITILLLHVVVDTVINVVKCSDFIVDNIVIPRGRNGTYILPCNLEFLFPVWAFRYQFGLCSYYCPICMNAFINLIFYFVGQLAHFMVIYRLIWRRRNSIDYNSGLMDKKAKFVKNNTHSMEDLHLSFEGCKESLHPSKNRLYHFVCNRARNDGQCSNSKVHWQLTTRRASLFLLH